MYKYATHETVLRPLYLIDEVVFNWNGDEWQVEGYIDELDTMPDTLRVISVSGHKSLNLLHDTQVCITRPASTSISELIAGNLFVMWGDLDEDNTMLPYLWVMLPEGQARNLFSGEVLKLDTTLEIFKVKSE